MSNGREMEWDHVYVIGLAIVATTLLALEKANLSVVGIGLILAVLAPGMVDAKDAIAGFGNKAVVAVGALYVVGEGFLRTGAASLLASRILARTGNSEALIALTIMIFAAVFSAFVNNTLVVVMLMPVITSISRETGLFPSRFLIPLSYASIVGGMTTLVGTSTNLLVSGVLEDLGRPKIEMFEMSKAGLIFASVGVVYMATLGRHLLPKIPSLSTQASAAEIHEYVTEVTIGPGSPLIGKRIDDVGSTDAKRARASMVVRNEAVLRPPFGEATVQAGDILEVSGKVQDLASLHQDPSHTVELDTEAYNPSTMSFFEIALSPTSENVGRTVRDLHLKSEHGAVVVGVMRNGEHLQVRIADLRMGAGDVLLAFGNEKSRESLRESTQFHLIEGVHEKIYRRDKAPVASAIVAGIVVLFVLGVEPVTAALAGALAMVVSGCLTVAQANRSINWPILTFIAGTLALSRALESTGANARVAELFAGLGAISPYAVLAGLYLVTIVLTELVSNNAVAVIMTPVAIATAASAGIDERLLVLAVAFGASTSFANPLGYKTNLLVYGPGGYRFRDYLRVGLLMDVLLAATGLLILPWFWPM